MLHDGIAAGIFNATYSGAGSQYAPWDKYLVNSEGLLDLVLRRMSKDFESTALKMRKPWGQSQLDFRKLLVCLIFLEVLDEV